MKKNIPERNGKMNRAGKTIKYILKGTVALIGTALLLYLTMLHTHNTAIADDSKAYGMKVKLLEWNRVYVPSEHNFYGALVWKSAGNYFFTSGRNIGLGKNADDRPDYWFGQPSTIDPYLDFGKEKFITRDYHDIPYFQYIGKTGSYKGNGHNYIIHVRPDVGHTKFVHCPNNNIVASNNATTFTVLDGKGDNQGKETKNMKKASTKTANGYVRLYGYFAEEKCVDWFAAASYISVHKKDNWPTYDFLMYEVAERNYSAMSDYTITKGNIFVNEDSTFLLDGKTLTVEEDAVLSIKGTFYYNGNIDCAGTIILQEGATLMPYHPNKAAGNITLRDGGTLIIMPKARVLAGLPKGCMNATKDAHLDVQNGTIINYGLLAAGYTELNSNSVIEMHNGSLMYLGVAPDNKKLNDFLNSYTYKTDASALGLLKNRMVTTTSVPTVYMYPGSRFGFGSYQSGYGSIFDVHTYTKNESGNYVERISSSTSSLMASYLTLEVPE